jgi:hypothetical protein
VRPALELATSPCATRASAATKRYIRFRGSRLAPTCIAAASRTRRPSPYRGVSRVGALSTTVIALLDATTLTTALSSVERNEHNNQQSSRTDLDASAGGTHDQRSFSPSSPARPVRTVAATR